MTQAPSSFAKRTISHVLAWLAAMAVSLSSAATDVFIPDQISSSPNGRFRLEATSADNAGEKPRPFADKFSYTLTDTQSNQVIWKRQQPADEFSPAGLFVHDQMWVVIWTARNDLVALKPVTGEKALEFGILERFSKDERRQFVSETSAGPMWSGDSRWSFLEHDGTLFFVIRTWWDHRIIADLTGGKVVEQISPELQAACEASDRAYVVSTLKDAAQRKAAAKDEDDYEWLWRVFTAVKLASRMRVAEAVPFLRTLEESNYVGAYVGSFDAKGTYEDGDIDPFYEASATLRRPVQLALRELGEKPRELPCTWFFGYTRNGEPGDFVRTPTLPGPRAERIDLVKPGMKPLEVLQAIGAPDSVNSEKMAWEYDMDTESPFTLRVYWRGKKAVDRLERITPPLWQQGDTRYHELHN